MFDLKPTELRTNVLSGLTVSLALVPEAIAFALVAHVSPLTGLYAAFIVCLVTAALGGRHGRPRPSPWRRISTDTSAR